MRKLPCLLMVLVGCVDPGPALPEAVAPPPVHTATSAVVTYTVDGEKKTMTLDRNGVIQLTDWLKPAGRSDVAPAGGGARVQFALPGGKQVLLLMIEPDLVYVQDWGLLELGNRGFHDHLKKLVEKHEGRKVDLVGGR